MLPRLLLRPKKVTGPNLLANPGFETAGAGGADVFGSWVETTGTGGVIADEVSAVHGGGHACKLTRGTTTGQVAQNATVVPGGVYEFAVWAAGDGTNAGRVTLHDLTHAVDLVAGVSAGVTGADYGRYERAITIPAGCVTLQVQLLSTAANGGICYFDDAELRRIG